ncbi:hypothetical protein T484DRAFT_1908233 [Baffinella frigidus]|nr:hypothetical protein T484DRAFT_1908233 [Cryptophyta sp. CCMP2293]
MCCEHPVPLEADVTTPPAVSSGNAAASEVDALVSSEVDATATPSVSESPSCPQARGKRGWDASEEAPTSSLQSSPSSSTTSNDTSTSHASTSSAASTLEDGASTIEDPTASLSTIEEIEEAAHDDDALSSDASPPAKRARVEDASAIGDGGAAEAARDPVRVLGTLAAGGGVLGGGARPETYSGARPEVYSGARAEMCSFSGRVDAGIRPFSGKRRIAEASVQETCAPVSPWRGYAPPREVATGPTLAPSPFDAL